MERSFQQAASKIASRTRFRLAFQGCQEPFIHSGRFCLHMKLSLYVIAERCLREAFADTLHRRHPQRPVDTLIVIIELPDTERFFEVGSFQVGRGIKFG